jgi:hypothetical protein
MKPEVRNPNLSSLLASYRFFRTTEQPAAKRSNLRPVVGRRRRQRAASLAFILLFCGSLVPARSELIIEGIRALKEVQEAAGRRNAVPKPKNAEPEEKPVVVDPAYSDTLRFLNGDVLHGNLVSIDAQRGVRWKTPDSKSEIEFSMAKLSKILVPRPKAAPAPSKDSSCLVRLANGDELPGDLVTLDDEKLVLDTAYAGQVTFPRKRLQSVRMVKAGSAAVFEGPTGSEGWTMGRNRNNAWKYSDGGFTTTRPASIGRDLKLPAIARLEFDVAWRGQLQLLVNLYTEGIEEYGSNAYMLQLNSGYVYLQRIRRNSGGNNLGQAEVPGMQTRTRAHIDLLCNKETRSIGLLIDGALVKQWKDNQDWVGSGTSVLFVQQGAGYTRISNIRVTEWDGKLEDRSAPVGKSKDDLVELFNKDKISGDLKFIREGKMSFATAFATMDIPIDRVHQMDFAGVKMEAGQTNATDVKAVFATQGGVTFSLEKWEGDKVVASSPNFGQVTFKPIAFNQVVFNLEQQKKLAASLEFTETDDSDMQ